MYIFLVNKRTCFIGIQRIGLKVDNKTILVCTPQKYFHASKFSYLLCCNPIHKVKTKTRNGWETINSRPPKPIDWPMRNNEHS